MEEAHWRDDRHGEGGRLKLPEVEAEFEMMKVEVGLLKDLMISCLDFSDFRAEFLVCIIKRFVVE